MKKIKETNISQFCEKEVIHDKVRDPCHLTGEYRGPAHSKFKITVTQKQSNLIVFVFHKCSNYDCQLFF